MSNDYGDGLDWDAIEEENKRYARALKRKQRDYPASFFDVSLSSFNGSFNAAIKKPKRPKEPRVCCYCGKTFVPHDNRQRFCDRNCSIRAAVQRRKDRFQANVEARVCPSCGKAFKPKRHKQIFCCGSCVLAHSRKVKREMGLSLMPVHRLVTRTCPICGEAFETHNARKKYCSQTCVRIVLNQAEKDRRRRIKGAKV